MVDLEGSEATVALVLWGFGGVAKSVLASAVIQELDCISKGFKFCRVIIDKKLADESSHIMKLQKHIIYNFGGGILDLRNTEEGRQKMQKVVRNKRCLLFIDNVVDSYSIEQLLPTHFKEISGSVQKVMPSRHNNIKYLLSIKKLNEYHIDPLSYPAARVILRKTILGERQLNADFDEEGCINAIAEACKGVPLLLSEFGKYLRVERNQTVYKEVLKALSEGDFDGFVDKDMSEKLMFVYDKVVKFCSCGCIAQDRSS